MRRNIPRIITRVFSTQQPTDNLQVPTQPVQNPVDAKNFDIFDYAGHKYSYEFEKNYGVYDPQELWGQKLSFIDSNRMRAEKVKDNYLVILLFGVLVAAVVYNLKVNKLAIAAGNEYLENHVKKQAI